MSKAPRISCLNCEHFGARPGEEQKTAGFDLCHRSNEMVHVTSLCDSYEPLAGEQHPRDQAGYTVPGWMECLLIIAWLQSDEPQLKFPRRVTDEEWAVIKVAIHGPEDPEEREAWLGLLA